MKDTLFLQNSQTFFFGLRNGALAMVAPRERNRTGKKD
jgi:hypothetical protein